MTPSETAAQLRLAADWIERNMTEQPKSAELTPELAAKGYEQYGFGPGITVVEKPKPFTIPTPPPVMKWHREDGWTAEMLPPGTRPLCDGEACEQGDEVILPSQAKWSSIGLDFGARMTSCHLPTRTTRSLLFTHSGHEWTWHRAGDPCPCDEERRVDVLMFSFYSMLDCNPKTVRWSELKLCDGSKAPGDVIGWRYADTPEETSLAAFQPAEKEPAVAVHNVFSEAIPGAFGAEFQRKLLASNSDPYAELKKAHAEGKVIQGCIRGHWIDCTHPTWKYPLDTYRIKPDEIPWIEWHGGPCPLNDEEVEEWEYKLANGFHCERAGSRPSNYEDAWTHNERDGITAYRVLKWREKKPKVPLGPEDVRCGDELLMAGKRYGILTVTDSSVEYLAASGPVQVTFEWLQKNGVTIRRRNSDAWESCEK